MDFDSLQDDSQTPAPQAPNSGPVPAHTPAHAPDEMRAPLPSFDSLQDDSEKYGTLGQQVITGLEGAAQGVAGPLAPLAEQAFGVNPEDIRLRAETNPWTHGLSEAAGFGAGLLAGTGEAALVDAAGQLVGRGVTQAITKGAATSTAQYVGARLAAGAAKVATEMAMIQTSDEVTKAITHDPNQTAGSVVANVGLSGVLGGLTGSAFSGLGMAGKAAINSNVLKEFADRLAWRGSNLPPGEMMQKEMSDAINSFHQIGDEVNGVTGLKAQALKAALPSELTPAISTQVQDVANKAQFTLQQMVEKDAPKRLITDYQGAMDQLMESMSNPASTPEQHFEALNTFKNDLQDYSKGRWGINSVQRTSEDYHFINLTKSLAHDVRTGLENPEVWGGAATVQKDINSAWKATLPYVKQVTTNFMSKVGDEYVVDPKKFASYIGENGRATSATIRQQRLGGFLDGLEKFHDTVANVAEKAGIENPIDPVGLGTLKESVEKASVGTKLADLWYDKLGPKGLGDVMGGAVGGAIGHATHIPEAGFGGAYLGKWALGPVFTSVIKPIMEKGPDLPAFRAATGYAKAVLQGEAKLTSQAAEIFDSSAKTIPQHLFTEDEGLQKLDQQLKKVAENPTPLMNVTGNLGTYMPDHAQAVAHTAMNAANFLNAQRPNNPKMSPLDSPMPPTKMQQADFHRTLAIANNPLQAMQHIKTGTLLPKDVDLIKTLYPAYYQNMSQKLMNAMTDQLAKQKTISYQVRQSLSLFLGQPLDSTMTPQSIQSIQSVFLNKSSTPQSQQASPQPRKGSTQKLGKVAQNLMTPDQARASSLRSN